MENKLKIQVLQDQLIDVQGHIRQLRARARYEIAKVKVVCEQTKQAIADAEFNHSEICAELASLR